MSAARATSSVLLARLATVALALVIWFVPPPEGLTVPAWRLFALFVAAIFSVIVGAFPILTASVFAAAAAVLTGLLTPAQAYAGFANPTILLIVMAFLVARAVVKCGLGQRLGHLVVSLFGKSTLGLSYSIFLVDGLIAPAFPSNTARGGVIYPLVVGLAEAGGATPGNASRRKLGGYLMFSGMASLSLSSALWFTAMAANPLGAEMARSFGVDDELRILAGRVVGADACGDGAAAVDPAADHVAGSDEERPTRRLRRNGRWRHSGPSPATNGSSPPPSRGWWRSGPRRAPSASTRRPSRCSASASCWRPAC